MIKKGCKFILWLLVLVAVISAVHYIWIAVFWYRGDYFRYQHTVSIQTPIHIKICAKDQYGIPATGYKVAIKLFWVSRYHWLFPLWAGHKSTYVVKTDHEGIATLSFLTRKAYLVAFEEVSKEKYVFPMGKRNPEIANFNNNPRGMFYMRTLDEGGQIIDMRVLRHDPPVKLIKYRPGESGNIVSGRDSLTFDPQDELTFTVNLKENTIVPGKQTGDVFVTIRNARTSLDLLKRRYDPNYNFSEQGEWTVICESLDNSLISQADMEQVATFAPEAGYKKRLMYKLTIKKEWLPDEAKELNMGTDWAKLVTSSQSEEEYVSIGPRESFNRAFHVRRDNPVWYGLVHIGIGLKYREDRVTVDVSGAYNPSGSNNFWTGSGGSWENLQ